MKGKAGLSLNDSSTTRRWRIGLSVVLIIGLLGGAVYAWQQMGQDSLVALSLFATPTMTSVFTNTPVQPTSTLFDPTETSTITPTSTRSGAISYVIKEGDTLYFVAEEYEIDIQDLISFNTAQGVDLSSFLQVGQEILVPPPDYQAPTLTPIPDEFTPGSIIEHTIRPGDILQLLADEFNTTLDAILAENEELAENPDILSVGQIVRIPVDIIALTPATPTRQPSVTPTPEPSSTSTPSD
jgi:LysM repeat protein|tara:strand:- start:3084 stop:3803 length:720 start_codon:yes stop_codon:yes gene_type:complete